jgi:hypothetical protein
MKEALRQKLETLRQMTPTDYAALDNAAWDELQDLQGLCHDIDGRISVLEALQPIPSMSEEEIENVKALTLDMTQENL